MARGLSPTLNLDAAVKAVEVTWQDYKTTAEPRGLAFGESLYKLRELIRAQGRRTKGNGVVPYLEERKIPISTAYFWMERFEISSGKRTPVRMETCAVEQVSREDRIAQFERNVGDTYAGLEVPFERGLKQVKDGDWSLASFVRQMDWRKEQATHGPAPVVTDCPTGKLVNRFVGLIPRHIMEPAYQQALLWLVGDKRVQLQHYWERMETEYSWNMEA